MRMMVGCLALVVATSGSAEACNDEMLVLREWQANASHDGRHPTATVTANLTLEGDRAYRMIRASVVFSDALGNALVNLSIDRDQSRKPGELWAQTGLYRGDGARIASLNPDDVRATTCVWSVVYDDGEVVEY